MPPSKRDALYQAAIKQDFERLKSLAAAYPEALNALDSFGEPLLESVTASLSEETELKHRGRVVEFLIAAGADPNQLGDEGTSALTAAILAMDSELLEVLLNAGADPNLPSGFFNRQTLYDWAVMDYMHETWTLPRLISTESSSKNIFLPNTHDSNDENMWLLELDRCAIEAGLRRPDYLFILRRYGALSFSERQADTLSRSE
ncbi:ankyrin repeat domain-containing protein [Pseudomonas luteola]